MKIGRTKLKMSSGAIFSFKTEQRRDNFERVAKFFKHHPRKAKKAYGK